MSSITANETCERRKHESFFKPPMIWEGVKGQPSRPVMPLDLSVRPIVDKKYIIPKTIDFIRREVAANGVDASPFLLGN